MNGKGSSGGEGRSGERENDSDRHVLTEKRERLDESGDECHTEIEKKKEVNAGFKADGRF